MRLTVKVAHLAIAGELTAEQAGAEVLKRRVAALQGVVRRDISDLRTEGRRLHLKLFAAQIALDHNRVQERAISNLLIRN